jgi:hypothetical protein
VQAASEGIVATMTSQKNVGRIIGFIVLSTFLGLLLCWLNDKRVARKQKDKQRRRRLMGIPEKSYARRRTPHNNKPVQKPNEEGEMA